MVNVNTKKLELIQELKELRQQKGMTYQQIADKTVANGEAVSLSTVKLVFSTTRTHDHDYNNVLKPIANALSDEDTLEIKVLQTRLSLKDEIISQLRERLARKEQRYRDQEAMLLEQLAFYRDEVKFKSEEIKRFQQNIDRKDAMLRKYLMDGDKE